MSTILKALKKLEQEKEGQRADIQRPGTDLITRQVFSRTVRFVWLKRIGLLWFCILFVVVIGGVGVYLIARGKGTALKKNISNQQPLSTETSRAEQITGRTAARFPTQSAAIPDNSPLSDQQLSTETDPPNKNLAQQPRTGTVTGDGPLYPQEPSALEDDTKPSSPGGGKAPSPGTAPTTSYPGARPMTDGRLSVQAIAWSPIAQECMAVVNDRIVHPGDAVDGFIVLAVEPDQIVVRFNQQTWSVPFGQGKSGN